MAVFTRIFVQSLIGVIQATETIKLLIGQGEPLVGRLLMYDALAMRFREIRIRRDPACPLCGVHPTITALQDYEAFCGLDAAALATSGASRLAPSTACAGVETQRSPSPGRPLGVSNVQRPADASHNGALPWIGVPHGWSAWDIVCTSTQRA